MDRPLQIAVADDDAVMRNFFGQVIPRLGHQLACLAASGSELIEKTRAQPPDLIILGTDMNGLKVAETISGDGPIPVILISSEPDTSLVERADAAHIGAYLIRPITQIDLVPAIDLTIRRFKRWQSLAAEIAAMQKLIDQGDPQEPGPPDVA